VDSESTADVDGEGSLDSDGTEDGVDDLRIGCCC
jgi:hypothetical protein